MNRQETLKEIARIIREQGGTHPPPHDFSDEQCRAWYQAQKIYYQLLVRIKQLIRDAEEDEAKNTINAGTVCPQCGSDEVTDNGFMLGSGNMRKFWTCSACEAEWEDNYTINDVRIHH